ncbi:MAG: hypothetical protein GXY65_03975 [Rhodococcus sp.]|uniref:hypothetical protein n=1 Tax=Rhodococcus TaxID=1827 RepID=UPI001694C7B1|nr:MULTISPECIES: hypothetical protein [Rhodococcus]NLV78496.1 hypothetical protein [Rhodococcus sp. (in: high G+C Gram-positive bacteria)]
MFTADRPRTVTLPPMVLGGLRHLHRQMVRNNAQTASFTHRAGDVVFDVCLVVGEHEPELIVRAPARGIGFTVALSTHFRAVPMLDTDTYRRLCETLAPQHEPDPEIVADLLRSIVEQAPAVLARTHPCAA